MPDRICGIGAAQRLGRVRPVGEARLLLASAVWRIGHIHLMSAGYLRIASAPASRGSNGQRRRRLTGRFLGALRHGGRVMRLDNWPGGTQVRGFTAPRCRPDATAFAHLVDDGGYPRAVQRFLRGWRASSSRDVELPVEGPVTRVMHSADGHWLACEVAPEGGSAPRSGW